MINEFLFLVILLTMLLSGLIGFLLRSFWLQVFLKVKDRLNRPHHIKAAEEVFQGQIVTDRKAMRRAHSMRGKT